MKDQPLTFPESLEFILLALPPVLISSGINWKCRSYFLACCGATIAAYVFVFLPFGFRTEPYVKLSAIIFFSASVFLTGIPFAVRRLTPRDWISMLAFLVLGTGWLYVLMHFFRSGGGDLWRDVQIAFLCVILSCLISLRAWFLKWKASMLAAGYNLRLPWFLGR